MMNNTLKKQFKFSSGTRITGKWHKQQYTIVKELGYGANGIVYLARTGADYVALKMSDSSMSVTSEVNVLKAFAKVQGAPLGPSLLDVDDWEISARRIPFYVMEYIQGPDLLTFVQNKGFSWTGVLVVQLLNDLDRIHQEGWVFGDLKPDNLIVTGPPYKIRCIDVGGTTMKGRAIKEFTEFFDRGYWLGHSRKAEPAYDLFSAAMILINLSYPKRFNKSGAGGIDQLRNAVMAKPELKKLKGPILGALEGKFTTALEMRQSMLNTLSVKADAHSKPAATGTSGRAITATRQQVKRQKSGGGFLETILVVMIVSLLYVLYIYGELL
ncbi:protein kinase family protein [Bacillus salacetis]|uniref:Protein kinase family protein n=1 Tax=Bacillus salacetis TaxID=2315464 RepID=A0A3A1QU34_9BACI|nr:protein kinase family protein [Bacillus salacetis]RIW29854.1 protein kinase family protein [Bacillus salacetis]